MVVWSPDGRELVFESQRNGTFDLWIGRVNRVGEERLLHGTPSNEIPIDWSSDGRYSLYRSSDADHGASNLFALPLFGDDRTPLVVADSPFEERMGAFSPDGRWVTYDTDQSGRFEVVVRAFPQAKRGISGVDNGGLAPQWSADGREIYFVSPDEMMMAAQVDLASGAFVAEKPVPLFATHIGLQSFNQQYAVTRDRPFVVMNTLADAPAPITVVLNWRP